MNIVAKALRFPKALPWLKDRVLNDRNNEVGGVACLINPAHFAATQNLIVAQSGSR